MHSPKFYIIRSARQPVTRILGNKRRRYVLINKLRAAVRGRQGQARVSLVWCCRIIIEISEASRAAQSGIRHASITDSYLGHSVPGPLARRSRHFAARLGPPWTASDRSGPMLPLERSAADELTGFLLTRGDILPLPNQQLVYFCTLFKIFWRFDEITTLIFSRNFSSH